MSFGALFLMISPQLRDLASGCIAAAVGSIVKYSPWSFIGAMVGLVVFAAVRNYRSPSLR